MADVVPDKKAPRPMFYAERCLMMAGRKLDKAVQERVSRASIHQIVDQIIELREMMRAEEVPGLVIDMETNRGRIVSSKDWE